MKLQKIAKLCKSSKRIIVMDNTNRNGELRRFIGDGYGMYAVDGLGEQLTASSIFTIFDIPTDERAKYEIRIEQTQNQVLEDLQPEDTSATDSGLCVSFFGSSVVPFQGSDGKLVQIDPEYLSPFSDESKETSVMYFRREKCSGIIVVRGLFETIAVIAGVEIDERFREKLIILGRRLVMEQETATNEEGENRWTDA